MKKIIYFLLFLLGCLPFAIAKDPEPSISVKAELSNAFITIGDPVEYTITIKRDPSIQLLSIPSLPPKDIFHVKKIDEFKRDEKGMIAEGKKIVLTAFQLGEFIIPPIEVEYRTPGGENQTIGTQPIYLTVKSIAEGEEKQDIRGLKSVVAIPQKWIRTVLYAAASVLVGLIGFLIYRWLRRRALVASSEQSQLTPEQQALYDLNKLFDSDLLKRGRVKEYYSRLSEILRVYFEKRLQILAVESTTKEIHISLKQKEMEGALVEKVIEVLEGADLAKFAKWLPEPVEIIRINKKAKEIIDDLKPKEVPHGV